MAKIEKEFLDARGDPGARAEDYEATPFLPRKPIPDIGQARIDGERFHSQAFMEREWEMVWTKTWNIGCHESELPDPGSFRVHTLGRESFIFVRGDDEAVRGFFNVCQHRGNQLCQIDRGDVAKFKCPFHGWEWNLDGTLRRVMHPHLFPQFRSGVPEGELGLSPVQVARWGGWIWFNMDPNAQPLASYLGEAGLHLETYELEKFSLIDHKTFEWPGNWKHTHDAFNESYHFEALHPEFLHFAEGFDVPIELMGIHSRMLNFNLTISELMQSRDKATPLGRRILGLDEDFTGSAKDLHLDAVARKRAIQDDTHLPYARMNDEQLVHQYHYTFFPGTTFTCTPEAVVVFRYLPHATDPATSYFDLLILRHEPPGTQVPEVEHKLFRPGDLPDYGVALDDSFGDPVFALIVQQDSVNIGPMQRGTGSRGFRGMILGDQEVRLRHFQQTIDRFLMGDAPRQGDR